MNPRLRFLLAVLPFLLAALVPSAGAEPDAPIAPSVAEPPPAPSQAALLRPGQTVVLRVRQVIPCDGLSAGERLLSGRGAIARGDRILAEVTEPRLDPPALIGGTIVQIAPPKRFGKPGRVTLELGQLVRLADGRSELLPWVFDLEDRRFNVQMRRRILLALFAAEGLGVGASIGSQVGQGNLAFIGGGAGLGLLSGIGYASLMPGREGSLEPGDTFRITVGTLSYRPILPSPPLSLHPAPDPSKRSRARKHGP